VRNFFLTAAGKREKQGNYFDDFASLSIDGKQIES
jgi:hypothetical protein